MDKDKDYDYEDMAENDYECECEFSGYCPLLEEVMTKSKGHSAISR